MAATKRDSEKRRRYPVTATVCCHGLDWESPAPRLGKKDKPLRTFGIRAGNPKKPDPSLL